jgi:hypothetical protein
MFFAIDEDEETVEQVAYNTTKTDNSVNIMAVRHATGTWLIIIIIIIIIIQPIITSAKYQLKI